MTTNPLGQESITLRRFATTGAWVGGYYVPGTSTDTTILASVQPAGDDDMQSLPLAERSKDARRLYSNDALRILDQRPTPPIPADRVVIDGDVYEVRKSQRERSTLAHYRSIAVRIDEELPTPVGLNLAPTRKQTIEQGIRSWLIACAGPNMTLPDDTVILANQKGPRPRTSYLTVLVSVIGERYGEDRLARTINDDDAGQVRTIGLRYATVSIQGFGEETCEWLEQARLSLPTPDAIAIFDAAEIVVTDLSPITNLSAFLDTAIEPRYGWDVRVDYQIESADQADPGLVTVGFADVVYDPDGDSPLTDTFTVPPPS